MGNMTDKIKKGIKDVDKSKDAAARTAEKVKDKTDRAAEKVKEA